VTIIGKAGSGKTLLAVAAALFKTWSRKPTAAC
jgi:predicted ribonuclease YlaK